MTRRGTIQCIGKTLCHGVTCHSMKFLITGNIVFSMLNTGDNTHLSTTEFYPYPRYEGHYRMFLLDLLHSPRYPILHQMHRLCCQVLWLKTCHTVARCESQTASLRPTSTSVPIHHFLHNQQTDRNYICAHTC